MERLIRKPFQGVTNIIRFNWHYYVIAFVLIIVLVFSKRFFEYNINLIATIIILLAISGIAVSLIVSWYIYDHSGLYSLNWLNFPDIGRGKQIVNINAGFDETSWRLKEKYPGSKLFVFDFYDSKKHTEISIERARKSYSVFPGTQTINTDDAPLTPNSADYILLMLAAHEIRSENERVIFFSQLRNALCDDGKIIVAEHQRDIYNFIAYNFGFMHFLSGKTWQQTFIKAGLSQAAKIKLNPFISAFILQKNGVTS